MARNVAIVFRLAEDVTPEIFSAKVFHTLVANGVLREYEGLEELHSGYKWTINPHQVEEIMTAVDTFMTSVRGKDD